MKRAVKKIKRYASIIKTALALYTSGAVIALAMVVLLFFGKASGFPSNLRTMGAACGAGKRVKFFGFKLACADLEPAVAGRGYTGWLYRQTAPLSDIRS